MLNSKKHLGSFGMRFSKALSIFPLEQYQLELLQTPKLIAKTSFSVRMDSGTPRLFHAIRLQLHGNFGPTKGGVRFHPEVNEENMKQLADRILIKCAVNGLPHGGAAGGIRFNPKHCSLNELRSISEAYIDAYAQKIGHDVDILSPDIGTNAQIMTWMSARLNQTRAHFEPAAINGKIPALGGIHGRHTATAIGALAVLAPIASAQSQCLTESTWSIQGFGAAGGTLAQELHQLGAKIVAISDSSCGWYCEDGLPIPLLLEHKIKGLSLEACSIPSAKKINPDSVLEVKADWVIAAALGGAIHRDNASKLNCRNVVEIANAAVTNEAEAILEKKRICIIPDVVVNAGGITASHFEWCQGRQGFLMNQNECHKQLKARMRHTAERLLETSADQKVSLAVAAQLLALDAIRNGL